MRTATEAITRRKVFSLLGHRGRRNSSSDDARGIGRGGSDGGRTASDSVPVLTGDAHFTSGRLKEESVHEQ